MTMVLFGKIDKKVAVLAMISVSLTGEALAAVPKLSGNYIVSLASSCQATVTSSNTIQPGEIVAALYQLRITPNSTGVAGAISLSGYHQHGYNLRRSDATNPNNTLKEEYFSNKSYTYTNTATALKMGGNQFRIYYGNIDSAGIAHYAAVTRLRNDDGYSSSIPNKCAEQGTFVRQ